MIDNEIKQIYVNGCGWTRQQGISSDPDFPSCEENERFAIAETFSWPNLVAAHFNANLRNDAISGSSNSRIVRTTCNFIRMFPSNRYNELMVIIGWTAPEKDEIYIEYNDHKEWYPFDPFSAFSVSNQKFTYPPHVILSLEEYHETYRRLIQNDKADLIRFFNQVFLLSNLLENLGIKYLFFSSIGFLQTRNESNALDFFERDFSLLCHRKYMGMDQKKTMLAFCQDNAAPLSPCMHPMIKGHGLWGNIIIKTIGEIF